PFQLEVERTGQPGAVCDHSADERTQRRSQRVHRPTDCGDRTGIRSAATAYRLRTGWSRSDRLSPLNGRTPRIAGRLIDLRTPQTGAAGRHHERVDRKLARFMMRDQLEAISKQRSEHRAHLLRGPRAVDLGVDVEPVLVNPLRSAHYS